MVKYGQIYLFIYLFTDRDLNLEMDNTYPSTRLFTNFYTTKIYNVHSLRHKKKPNSKNMPKFFILTCKKNFINPKIIC